MAFVEPYCHQAEIVSVPGSSPGCAAEACPGAGRRLEGSGGGWWRLGKEGSGGSCACPWTPGSGPSRHLCAGSPIGAEEVTQKPQRQPEMADLGSFLGLPSANGPGPRAPGPLNASAPSEERGLLTPAWPQAGHPAIPQKGHYRKCPPGSLQTVVSCFPWAQPKMADREAPPRWAVWAWGCLLCPQGP